MGVFSVFRFLIILGPRASRLTLRCNLVPRACDPREGNEGSGIIRFREDSDWPLKWMRSSILATIPGFRQRIIPEPSFPSQGSQARGTRLTALPKALAKTKTRSDLIGRTKTMDAEIEHELVLINMADYRST